MHSSILSACYVSLVTILKCDQQSLCELIDSLSFLLFTLHFDLSAIKYDLVPGPLNTQDSSSKPSQNSLSPSSPFKPKHSNPTSRRVDTRRISLIKTSWFWHLNPKLINLGNTSPSYPSFTRLNSWCSNFKPCFSPLFFSHFSLKAPDFHDQGVDC